METSLHQQLKQCYAADAASTEVTIGSYRIDAIRDHELIEIQCASLGAIRRKCTDLLRQHTLRVVKPVISRTRIVKLKKAGGTVVSRRMSPSRGSGLDAFEELIYFTRVFPHPNLIIEIAMVNVEQVRVPAKRRRRWHQDYRVQDTRLEEITEQYELRCPTDLLKLVGWPSDDAPLNTLELAETLERPRWFAQKVAYVLHHTGAIEAVSRNRTGVVYCRAA